MKNMFTLKHLLFAFTILMGLISSHQTAAQTRNWAVDGNAVWENTNPSVPPNPVGFTSVEYSDDTIGAYPSVGFNEYTFVTSGQTIKAWWAFPNAIQKIDKIVFYKNQRPMTSCMILKYDWITQSTDTIASYYNINTDVADSILVTIRINPIPFPAPVGQQVDTIYFVNVESPQGNPDFREIQLVGFNRTTCIVGTDIVGGIEQGPISAGPGLGNILTICPGYSAYLGALPQTDSMQHFYQWQYLNGATWTSITGATNMGYVYDGYLSQTFRVLDSCNGAIAAVPSTNTIQVVMNPASPYLPLNPVTGYIMNFNTAWQSSSCLPSNFSGDLPSAEWANNDPYGFTSWRSSIALTNNGTLPWSPTSWPNTSGAPPTPNTSIPYGVNFGTTNGYARVHTYNNTATNNIFDTGRTANLDLFLDLSNAAIAGDKALTFYYINAGPINFDSLRVLMSTNAGSTWTLLGTFDTANAWKKRMLPIASNSSQTIIRFQAFKAFGNANTDIGLDSIFVAPPCSGTPVAGRVKSNLSFAKVVSVCAGTSLELTTLGSTIAGNLVYEWQHSYNLGATFTPVNGGMNSNNLFFTTPPIYDTMLYRLALKCGASGTVVYSDTFRVNLSGVGPTYAAIPYRQSFETWTSRCGTNDVPVSPGGAINWTNSPFTGNNSWRRENQGNNASWTNPTTAGIYSPVSAGPFPSNATSARFHSGSTLINQKGTLDLLFNGSGVAGDKELRFYYLNTTGNDSMSVHYSVDSGRNFTRLDGYKTVPQWSQFTLQVPCSSSKCIVRFQGSGQFGDQTDIGLDSVTIYPPCVGTPSAGILVSSDTLPCPGETFTLSLQGFSITGGLSFTWTKRLASSPFWTSAQTDTTKTFFTTSIQVPTWFKVVVRCKYTGMVDSTEILMNVAAFYYCYCGVTATTPTGIDIGNVNIKRLPAGTNLLNSGNPLPQNNNPSANGTYADYRVGNPAGWLPITPTPMSTYPTPIYHDTSYQLLVSQINSANFTPATITVWIDTDRNGLFDTDETFIKRTTSLTTTPAQRADTLLTLPPTTPTGLTGMRVMIEQGSNINSVPCGTISNGEIEDYLVEIRDHPCTGPATAGIVETSDTAVCVNYAITLVDTTHATKQYGLRWVWQYSPDSNAWADITGSQGRDTVNPVVTNQTWYRVRMVCLMTFDTTYSNVVKVIINPPYACYCFSLANGGSKDTSDIGGMSVTGSSGKGFFVPSVGPHLLNPWAVRERTDYTKDSMLHLYLDSTYQFLIYHTMTSATHADAKITLFMDINNDGLYNITNNPFTNERLWTGFTTSTYFTVVDSITIPTYGIPGIPTGMRLILNNNTGPNKQSDSACGPYTSGETEDYVVVLHNPANPWWPLTVNDVSNITNLYVYPNPTTGKFWVKFDATKHVDEATIVVTNVTGQQMIRKYFANPGKKLMEEIDLSNLARGVYMVEVKADSERLVRKLIVR